MRGNVMRGRKSRGTNSSLHCLHCRVATCSRASSADNDKIIVCTVVVCLDTGDALLEEVSHQPFPCLLALKKGAKGVANMGTF